MTTLLQRVHRHAVWVLAGSLLLLMCGGVLATVPADATPGSGSTAVTGRIVEKKTDSGEAKVYTATKTLTRSFVNDDGSTYDFPSNTVTVNAYPTQDLQSRQRVRITWSGAQPSGARASNPYGENGENQEYPVVVLQCRGVDDPSAPADQQVSPETCWTNAVSERSQVNRAENEASWLRDANADESQKQAVSITGDGPLPSADECPTVGAEGLFTHLTPFIAASGKVYPACSADTMPPEAGVGGAYPAAEIAGFTDADGNGAVQFEVRTSAENESLGCDSKTPCTLEVIPINGLSCQQQADPATLADSECRKGGQYEPGSSNFASQGVDQAVSWPLWWSASNWDNRIAVPVTFGLPPDVCDVLDSRAPTGFYGSELLSQASLQWSPAYCLNKNRFKYQHNVMSDDAGFQLMDSGGGAAALVSSSHKKTSDDPVGYAPTAVTGFGIGYVIDEPNNGGQYTNLKLTPRLVAKLLTQSYLGSDLGQDHPGMKGNPYGIMSDPEFVQLNPGLSQDTREAGAVLMSLSVSSDVLHQLTDWIAHDKDAMDFVNGKPDPWGMRVNPAYKKIKLPKAEWPLKDTYVPTTSNACRQANPSVYANQLAAPVSNLRIIAQALLDAWPLLQTRCDADFTTGAWKLGRVDRQNYGNRFMLGLVSLGDAQRYGLDVAQLETKGHHFVAPNDASMTAAVDLMHVRQPNAHPKKKGGSDSSGSSDSTTSSSTSSDDLLSTVVTAAKQAAATSDDEADGQPFVLDMDDVRKSTRAYPGTMVVYTAARERNLAKADATKVSEFIKTSTTEGQKPGTGNGELPAGFLPIEKTGPTKKLYDSAQYVAQKVAAQTPAKPEPTAKPSDTSTANPTLPAAPDDFTPTLPDVAPSDLDAPSDAPVPSDSASASASPTSTVAVSMPPTQAVSSDLGNRAVPVLLLLGLIGIALTSAVRFFVRPSSGRRP